MRISGWNIGLLLVVVLAFAGCNSSDEITKLADEVPSGGSAACEVPGSASPSTVNYFDRGWWDENGAHDPTNDFVFVGWTFGIYTPAYLTHYAYILFDVSAYAGRIQGATLRIEQEGFVGPDPSEVITVLPVTTDSATLDSNATSVFNPSVPNDLSTGVPYASRTFFQADFGKGIVADLPLSSQAVCDLNTAPGGIFAVGLRGDSLTRAPSVDEWMRFGFGGGNLNELVLQVVP